MSYDRLPDQITGPMTTSQATTLRSLAVEAYQEKLFQAVIAVRLHEPHCFVDQ
jgi:hypothetical protein